MYNKEKEKSVFTVCDTSLLLTEDVKFPKRFFVFSSLLYMSNGIENNKKIFFRIKKKK